MSKLMNENYCICIREHHGMDSHNPNNFNNYSVGCRYKYESIGFTVGKTHSVYFKVFNKDNQYTIYSIKHNFLNYFMDIGDYREDKINQLIGG